jgi:hypothetical protein
MSILEYKVQFEANFELDIVCEEQQVTPKQSHC